MFAAMQAHTALAETTLDVTVRVMCLSEDENGNLLDESQARGWGEITVHVTNKDTGEHYETVSDYDGNAAFSLPEGTYTWLFLSKNKDCFRSIRSFWYFDI